MSFRQPSSMQQDYDGSENGRFTALKLSTDLEKLTLMRIPYPESQEIFKSIWNRAHKLSRLTFVRSITVTLYG